MIHTGDCRYTTMDLQHKSVITKEFETDLTPLVYGDSSGNVIGANEPYII